MGRMSDRIANRRNPLFRHVKELVTGAVLAASTADTSALVAQLDAKLDILSAEQFEEAMGMAFVELRQRRGSEDSIQTLVATALDVSQALVREDGTHVTLFGLVLQMSDAVQRELSQEQVQALVRIMVRHGLVADAKATVMPRLLWPDESNALRTGEVYALCRSLSGVDPVVTEWLDRFRTVGTARLGEAPALDAGRVVILMGVVDEQEGIAFTLPAHLESQLPPADAAGQQPLGYAFAPPHLLDELHRKLAAFGSDLAAVLQCSEVQVTQPAGSFAQANMHAVNLQRAQRTRALLARLAGDHSHGRLAGLVVGPAEPVETGLSAPVYRRLDHAAVGSVQWPLARYEPPQDGLLHLLTLLNELELLEAPDDAASSRLMH
jgi:hypothetical protein